MSAFIRDRSDRRESVTVHAHPRRLRSAVTDGHELERVTDYTDNTEGKFLIILDFRERPRSSVTVPIGVNP